MKPDSLEQDWHARVSRSPSKSFANLGYLMTEQPEPYTAVEVTYQLQGDWGTHSLHCWYEAPESWKVTHGDELVLVQVGQDVRIARVEQLPFPAPYVAQPAKLARWLDMDLREASVTETEPATGRHAYRHPLGGRGQVGTALIDVETGFVLMMGVWRQQTSEWTIEVTSFQAR